MPDQTSTIAVEDLHGGEQTTYGEFAYSIQEADGVDAVFLGPEGEEPYHFEYGTQIVIVA